MMLAVPALKISSRISVFASSTSDRTMFWMLRTMSCRTSARDRSVEGIDDLLGMGRAAMPLNPQTLRRLDRSCSGGPMKSAPESRPVPPSSRALNAARVELECYPFSKYRSLIARHRAANQEADGGGGKERRSGVVLHHLFQVAHHALDVVLAHVFRGGG